MIILCFGNYIIVNLGSVGESRSVRKAREPYTPREEKSDSVTLRPVEKIRPFTTYGAFPPPPAYSKFWVIRIAICPQCALCSSFFLSIKAIWLCTCAQRKYPVFLQGFFFRCISIILLEVPMSGHTSILNLYLQCLHFTPFQRLIKGSIESASIF